VPEITDEQFEILIGEALDSLPEKYVSRLLKDVAVTWEDEPSLEQREKLELRHDQTLFGLYEGVSLPRRNGMTGLMPDKITIFKGPMLAYCRNLPELKEQIRKTLWHEMAHYFGLDHPKIYELGGH
jgi:predicted Zn-dependent protease with MMP-like domain